MDIFSRDDFFAKNGHFSIKVFNRNVDNLKVIHFYRKKDIFEQDTFFAKKWIFSKITVFWIYHLY